MFRALLLTLFILIVLPAAANAACRTAPLADVHYESPAVQVWTADEGIVACVRATGQERVVPYPGGDEGREYREVIGERWLHTVTYRGYESDTTSIEWLTDDLLDLRTGATLSSKGFLVPGGIVAVETGGIVARYIDGRTEVVDAAPGKDLALRGRRLYWRAKGQPRTALLNLPDAGPAPAARPLPFARKMTRCTPRPGARLVVRYRRIVVTRVKKTAFVCFNGRTTKLGNANRFQRLNSTDLAYTRPGYTGYINAQNGWRRELERVGGEPLLGTDFTIAAHSTNGALYAWSYRRDARQLTADPATEVAVGFERVYWLAADGTPRTAVVRAGSWL